MVKYKPPNIEDIKHKSIDKSNTENLLLAFVKQFGGVFLAEIIASKFEIGDHSPQKKLQTLQLKWLTEQVAEISEKIDKITDIVFNQKSERNRFNFLDYFGVDFEKCPRKQAILLSIHKDITRHFQDKRNPLFNSYHQTEATRNCLEYCPGNRMKTPELPLYPSGKKWAPELLWAGEKDYESIKILQNHRKKIQVSVHSMMVSTYFCTVRLR